MKIVRILLLLIVGLNLQLKAQISKGEFDEKFAAAELYFIDERYPLALPLYLELLISEPTNANINYKIGVCYLKSSSEKNKATTFLENAIVNTSNRYMELESSEKSAPVNAYYYLGKSYHLDYKFDEAIQMFTKYLELEKNKKSDEYKTTQRQIEICNNGKEIIKNKANVIITSLGDSVNSKYAEYAPVISVDESTLIFTSRREGSTGDNQTEDGQYFEDIYVSSKENGVWGKARQIGSNINTVNHEATIGLSADGQQLLIYKDDNGDGNIYLSLLEGDQWSLPILLGSDINTPAWEPSACFSADGNTLYFVSDRKGGLGGRDLWRCVRLPNGEWSKALNLGSPINTPHDEDGPFMHPDGKTLYFASNGHKTMGGFDVFTSSRNEEDNTWSQPENIGYPVSTTDDDIFYVTSADGKRAFYSSAKEDGMGEKDLYMITFPDIEAKSIAILIGKIVTNDGGQIPLENKIIVTDVAGDSPLEFKANTKTGKYVLTLKPGHSYDISYTANGKEFFSEKVDVPMNSDYQEIRREVSLNPIVIGESQPADTSKTIAEGTQKPKDEPKQNYVSDGTSLQVFFDYNVKSIKATNTDFQAFADKLAAIIKDNPALYIVIEASASKVPTGNVYKTNETLAASRADAGRLKLIAALKAKKVDTSKLKIEKKSLVQGPDYKGDAVENRKEYEKYQYVKFSIK